MRQITILYFVGLIAICHHSYSQEYSEALDKPTTPRSVISNLPPPPPSQSGTVYLDKEWNPATITFNNGQELKGHDIRYDLKNSNIEIRTTSGIKICPLPRVAEFRITPNNESQSHWYMNAAKVSINGEIPMGLVEVLFYDEVKLFSYKYIIIKTAPYVRALDMGVRKKQIFKREQLYISANNKIYMLNKKLKNNKHIFGDLFDEVDTFSRNHKYKFKKQSGMLKIIEHFNNQL